MGKPQRAVRKGEWFTFYKVIEEVGQHNNCRMFLCRCICGQERVIRLSNLTSGRSRSCGCRARRGKRVHGFSSHPLYAVWRAMNARCSDPEDADFENYGGRGIRVCKRWRLNVSGFVRWALSKGWQLGLWLDRKNNDGNYTPQNCRFITPRESAANRRPQARHRRQTNGRPTV